MYFSYIGAVLSVVESGVHRENHRKSLMNFITMVVPKYTRAWAGIELKTVAVIGIFSNNHTLACIVWALNINSLQVKYNWFCWPVAGEHFQTLFMISPFTYGDKSVNQ